MNYIRPTSSLARVSETSWYSKIYQTLNNNTIIGVAGNRNHIRTSLIPAIISKIVLTLTFRFQFWVSMKNYFRFIILALNSSMRKIATLVTTQYVKMTSLTIQTRPHSHRRTVSLYNIYQLIPSIKRRFKSRGMRVLWSSMLTCHSNFYIIETYVR